MKKIELTTVTFEADYGFMIDIVDNANAEYPTWDVWLYRKDYGVKAHMFGLSKERTTTLEEVIEIVEMNLSDCNYYYSGYDDEYAQDAYREYEEEYDDDDEDDEDEVFETTVDEWKHVPAKGTVDSGFDYTLTAPSEEGFYTLYEQYDCDNNHLGWRWEKETA